LQIFRDKRIIPQAMTKVWGHTKKGAQRPLKLLAAPVAVVCSVRCAHLQRTLRAAKKALLPRKNSVFTP
jgi:hypothetical protein